MSMSNQKLSGTKDTPIPTEKEREIFKNLELEILNQITKSIKGHREMEAYFLAWTTIEQFMLPRLTRFVAKNLKIILPKDFSGLQISHLIKNYYFLSHDRELYLVLEKARKNRNGLVHEIYEKEDWKSIKKEYRKYLVQDIAPLFTLFQDRFTGKTAIPVLTLYTSGWNNALDMVIKRLKEKMEEF